MNSSRLIDLIARGATKKVTVALSDLECSLSPELLSVDGLKQAILEDPFIEVVITSKGSFKVRANNGSIFTESTLRDFYCGQVRVRAQYRTLQSLKQNKFAPPWDLTTAYYCAFFSAIELLRLYGTYQVSFDSHDHQCLLIKAQGNQELLKDSQNFFGNLSGCGEEIVFISSGQKPHQSVWNNFYNVVSGPFSQKYPDWKELHTFNQIVRGVNNWSKPSDIRNNWNYKKTEFYSAVGQPLASEFYSLVDSASSACLWLDRSFSVLPGEKELASSVAAVCEVLSSAVVRSCHGLISDIVHERQYIQKRHLTRRDKRRAKKRNR